MFSAIEDLVVEPEPPRRGYNRAEFEHWVDVDGSGCTVRHRVLAAQATALAPLGGPSGCQVREGDWELLFHGGRHRGSAGDIDVDHVVALAEAWDSGAAEWTAERRREFANDPLNLLVTDRQVNKDKGDLDAGEWAPSDRRSWCLTAAKMVLTKLRYSLRVDAAERLGLQRLARACDRTDQRTIGGFPLPGTDAFAQLLDRIRREVGITGGQ